MKRITLCISTGLLLWTLFIPECAHALVVVNEFLADPALSMAGDANGDGVRHSSNDEFVELFNFGDETADLSGWTLSDASSVRHQFGAGTLLSPFERYVIFGGGTLETFPYAAETASTGSLSLNNSNDEIFLRNEEGALMDYILFGAEANHDQSLTRFPEGEGGFTLHEDVSPTGLTFSPGTDVEGHATLYIPPPPDPIPFEGLDPVDDASEPETPGPAIPEPNTLLLTLCGFMMAWKRFYPSMR